MLIKYWDQRITATTGLVRRNCAFTNEAKHFISDFNVRRVRVNRARRVRVLQAVYALPANFLTCPFARSVANLVTNVVVSRAINLVSFARRPNVFIARYRTIHYGFLMELAVPRSNQFRAPIAVLVTNAIAHSVERYDVFERSGLVARVANSD